MAAPRASSFKALRNLQRSSSSTPAKRGLHMTGVHASPRPIDPTHKTTYTPWNLQDLRHECNKRTLSASGTKHELIDRLAGHDSLQARAFSIAMKRIASQQTKKTVSGPSDNGSHRHFNTSRENKSLHDTSTIDFAYLPDFDPDMHVAPIMRVPLLPDNSYSTNSHAFSLDAEPQEEIMRHEILTVSADSTHIHAPSRMADVTDNNSVDFHGMTERVAAAVGKTAKEVEEQASMAKKVWAGLLDDVFGAKPSKV